MADERYHVHMAIWLDPMPLAVLVDLVNGWGTAPRQEAGEQDLPYPVPDTVIGRLRIDQHHRAPSNADLTSAADKLYPVFAATATAERATLVNALLTDAGVRPALCSDADQPAAGWLIDDPAATLIAAAAVALRHQLADHPPDRLGTCAGRRCADIFIDASPNGRRRFCSLTCQNRSRVAAFRSRRTAPR
jgi:predicted RNA-binding Zn ribbon-like protein